MSKIKLHISQFISIVLIAVVLLPFGVQFVHSFTTHEHSICHEQNKTHFDTHEIDCSVLHFKIDTNSIDFYSSISSASTIVVEEKIYATKNQITSLNLHFKSSRAPPVLLFI